MKLGAQLYTVRSEADTPEKLSATLKKIAGIGYTTVQMSGTCAYDPYWLKDELSENGLQCVLTHYIPDRIANDTKKVIEEHRIFGCSRVGIGCSNIYESRENFDMFVSKYKPAAKVLRDNGMYLMYHNHNLEFNKFENENEIVLEMLCNAFAKDELGITLDTYWVQVGGGDPALWIRKLEGRIPCIHLKDLAFRKDKHLSMMPVGGGNMNFDAILKACADTKIQYALVEQDDCNGIDPFLCLKESYDYLKSTGLE